MCNGTVEYENEIFILMEALTVTIRVKCKETSFIHA